MSCCGRLASTSYTYFNFIIRVRTRVITCSHQPLTRGDVTVSVAQVILPNLTPSAAFATGEGMKTTVWMIQFNFV